MEKLMPSDTITQKEIYKGEKCIQFSSVQSLSHVQLFATP